MSTGMPLPEVQALAQVCVVVDPQRSIAAVAHDRVNDRKKQ
jgi:hypothetical protein